MPPVARSHPSEPPVSLAIMGRGWRLLRATDGGAEVPSSAIVARHRCRLPQTRPAATATATAALTWIDDMTARGLVVAGYVGYEIGAALEGLPLGGRMDAAPDAGDGRPRYGTTSRGSAGLSRPPDAALVAFEPDCWRPLPPTAPISGRCHAPAASPPADLVRQRASYLALVKTALAAIGEGRYYQLNLSVGFETAAPAELGTGPLAHVLGRLLQPQPVPFAMAMQFDDWRYFSLSMERFLGVTPAPSGTALVRSRPIKGTTRRDADPREDAANRRALCQSAKERAENTMIVDMVRNDLARVATLGSVCVPTLLEAVGYRTLWHLESEVHATLPASVRASDLLRATLPPASVTGCPKIAAMRAISALEGRRRGPYCGAVGVWLPDGTVDLSVGIRGVLQRGLRARFDVGAGIVADSDPEAEWRETCLKADAALRGVAGLG